MALKDKDSTYFDIIRKKIKTKAWPLDKELRKITVETHIGYILYTGPYCKNKEKYFMCTDRNSYFQRKKI